MLFILLLLIHEVTCVTDDVEILNAGSDNRRPIWNIAHMVNALYQVDYYLDEGANSLEFDVAFDWEGYAKYTFHGIPCDCFRSCLRYEHFVPFINYLRQLTTPGDPKFRERLVLLFMDLKVHGLNEEARVKAGADIAMKLLKHYWMDGQSGARAFILISVPSIAHMSFINSLKRTLQERNFTQYYEKIGFDFSGNEDLDSIRRTLQYYQINNQIWQGDGITNCLPRGTSRLREAVRRRDQGLNINKVYWWTVDKMATMRATLRLGVDGMITNYPNRLISILNEDEFSSKFRLATYEDNPWTTFKDDVKTAALRARGGNLTIYDISGEEELLYNC